MATYRKRASGRWQAVIRVKGFPPQNKTGFATKTQARHWAEREEVAMRTGTWADRSIAEHVTLGELLARYSQDVTPRKKGHATEQLRIKFLRRHPLSNRIVATLCSEDINRYITERLKEGRAGSTVNRELNLLHHLFVIARKRWGVNVVNPCADMERPKNPGARNRRLNSGEEQKLLEAVRAARNPWIEPMVILAIETAMRRSELLTMRWKDIDWDGSYIQLRDTKNGESRDVPLSPRSLDTLETLPRTSDERIIPVTLNAWRCAWRRARDRSGLPDFRFHDLRHEATSRLFEAGLGVMEVASVTGHKDLRMLARYTHPRARDIARKLALDRGGEEKSVASRSNLLGVSSEATTIQ